MSLPIAPTWFKRELKNIDPTLGVRFDPGSKLWEVFQMVPTLVHHGQWNNHPLFEIKRMPQRALTFKELGSRAFYDLRRNFCRNFSYEEFCLEHRVYDPAIFGVDAQTGRLGPNQLLH